MYNDAKERELIMYIFKPKRQVFIKDLTIGNVELTDIFSISKIYSTEYQIDLFTNKPIAPYIVKKESRNFDECPDCGGVGLIFLDDTVGKHSYSAECECAECEATGKVYFDEFKEFEIIQSVNFNYNTIDFTLEYQLAKKLFNLHGERCKYIDNGIIFEQFY